MENSERQTFEQHWQRAFEGAEAIPSEGIWLSIDSTLTKVENDRNKRRLAFYQRLAASLVLICTASFLITFWQWKNPSSNGRSETPTQDSKPSESMISKSSPSVEEKGKLVPEASVSKGLAKKNPGGPALHGISKGIVPIAFVNSDSPTVGESSLTLDTSHEIVPTTDSTTQITEPSVLFEKAKGLTEEEQKELANKLLAQIETIVPEKKESHHDVWASLGFAGGTYSPGTSTTHSDYSLNDPLQSLYGVKSPPPVNERSSLGTSYSIGLMVGKQLSKRWLVQTGFAYLNQRINYESSIVASSPQGLTAFTRDFAIANASSSYTITNPYTISRSTEFLSLPVQLGFVLVDRKVGVIMNAGVATDLFLRNTLTDQSGQYRNLSQSTGENAIFRTLSWSGLASTEITFRVAEHYRLALVPGVRYSFTNTIKDESGFSHPLVLDVGFRFRYIFK